MHALLENDSKVLERVIAAVKRVAADEIMPRFLRVAHQRKADGSLFTDADVAAQEALVRALREIRPVPVVGEEMTQALNDSLEAQVRAHMDQWFWIHRRWAKKIPGRKPKA